MNQTELPECEKISKKEPSKDVQMTQEQAQGAVQSYVNELGQAQVQLQAQDGQRVWWNI